jgi:predicted CXXCH cytochrome family protein
VFVKRTTFLCLAIIGFISMFLISCSDPVERHKVLGFFFDGVPPLITEANEGEMGPPRPDSMSEQTESGVEKQRKEIGYVHEPVTKDCNSCHKRMEKGQWALPEFKKKPPELCYDCHDEVRQTKGFVHGPVAVGECLFCHTPHRSPNKYLLKEKDPELCYKCHQKLWIMTMSAHTGESISSCLSCHSGHAGATVSLLKPDWNQKTK